MDRFELDASGRRTPLTRGYAISAPGLMGAVGVFASSQVTGQTRSSTPRVRELDAAFANAGVREAATIALDVRAVGAPATAPVLRSATGADALQLEVPDLGAERAQVVLAIDEEGALSWHFPLTNTRRFLIPRDLPQPTGGDAQQRSIVGAVGRKLLKVLVYPVTDPILGPITELFAHNWEEHYRPYSVRRFAADNFASSNIPSLSPDDWQKLASGRTLLFMHGVFTTSHASFGALPAELVAELNQRYGDRVIAFDSFTLSEEPGENASRFLNLVPEGLKLELDIVCHGRGGLIARELAVRSSFVKRVVFVGAPNAGTALADPDNLVAMIDRLSSALVLLPAGPISETMESILTAVKVIAHGATVGLRGLAAMRPEGQFLRDLNSAKSENADYYAITSDFEPREHKLANLIKHQLADAVVDRVFKNAANDLVVPTASVYDLKSSGFPIPAERILRFDSRAGVTHATYFGAQETAQALNNWLTLSS